MIYVASRAGIQHEICEDAVLVGKEVLSDTVKVMEMPKAGYICVADGVGGNRGGSMASRFVLEALAKVPWDAGATTRDTLIRINQDLLRTAKENPACSDMATTLTGVLLHDGQYQLIHVGNTRAYIRQGRYLKQLTEDHTTFNWLMSSGQVEEAEECNKNEITNCFGGGNPAYLSRLLVSSVPAFSFMALMSDGVHEYVDIDLLESVLLGEGEYEEKCSRILDEAESNGSEDDKTIVILVPGP